jgi:hypothetical protein
VNGTHYDWKGNEITQEEWVNLFSEDRKIGDDRIGEHHISTVYLGLNHQFGDGPPLIFETMIMDGPFSDQMWRWSTEQQARNGHKAILEALRAGLDPSQAVNGRDSNAYH